MFLEKTRVVEDTFIALTEKWIIFKEIIKTVVGMIIQVINSFWDDSNALYRNSKQYNWPETKKINEKSCIGSINATKSFSKFRPKLMP